jgi:AcrR family transcriptional regulator
VKTSTGLRERKKLATREALRHAAVTLYRRHGPDKVTVEDICAAAGVSPRTFFNYFATKDEAVFALDVDPADIQQRIVDRPDDEEPLEAIRAVFADLFAQLVASETWRQRTLLLRERPELAARLGHAGRAHERAIAAGIATRTGHSADNLYVRTTGAAAHATMRAAVSCWHPDHEPDIVALLHQAIDMLQHGLRPTCEINHVNGSGQPAHQSRECHIVAETANTRAVSPRASGRRT